VAEVQKAIARQAYWCLISSSAANENLSAPRNLICWTFQDKGSGFGWSGSSYSLHLLRWRSPLQGEASTYRIYDISSGQKILLDEVPGNRFHFFRQVSESDGNYVYAVMAVNSSYEEGSPAVVQPFKSKYLRKTTPDTLKRPLLKLALPVAKDFETNLNSSLLR
jgi:hypothetical protein